jgi:hypothetical protein
MTTVAKLVTPKTGRASWRKPVGRNRTVAEQRAVLAKVRKLVRDKNLPVTRACCEVNISDAYFYFLVKKFREERKVKRAAKAVPATVKLTAPVKPTGLLTRISNQEKEIAGLKADVDNLAKQVLKLTALLS